MQRRVAVLAVLALLAVLSGCSAAGSIELQSLTDADLAAEASRTADPAAPDHAVTNRSRADVVSAAVENGSVTVAGVRPPISDGLPFAAGGGYYDLSWAVVANRTAHTVDIGITYGDSAPNGTAVDYEDLPAADRAALSRLLPPREGAPTDDTIGVSVVYSDADLRESVLAPTQRYDAVVFEGQRYALTVEAPRAVTVATYRYTATEVAPNTSAYVSHLESAYAFTLSGLSGSERSVVESARDDTYYADSTDDEAFATLVDRFRAHEAIQDDGDYGTWLITYEGERYLVDLSYRSFVDQ